MTVYLTGFSQSVLMCLRAVPVLERLIDGRKNVILCPILMNQISAKTNQTLPKLSYHRTEVPSQLPCYHQWSLHCTSGQEARLTATNSAVQQKQRKEACYLAPKISQFDLAQQICCRQM